MNEDEEEQTPTRHGADRRDVAATAHLVVTVATLIEIVGAKMISRPQASWRGSEDAPAESYAGRVLTSVPYAAAARFQPGRRHACTSCRRQEPLLDRRGRGFLQRRSDPGAYRVETHVGHTGQQRPRIEQRPGAKAPFPKTAGAAVLAVGAPRNRFVEAAHEPAQIPQPLAPARHPLGPGLLGQGTRRLHGVREELFVALGHLLIGPGQNSRTVDVEDDVKVSFVPLFVPASGRLRAPSLHLSTCGSFPIMARVAVQARTRAMTLEEWAELDEDVEGELVDGVLEEEEMPSLLHEIVVSWLNAVLRRWAQRRGGQVAGSEAKIAVAAKRGRKPDLSLYLRGHIPPLTDPLVRVAPHLVVEVASPRPRDIRRDRVDKIADYARAGIPYYWILDPSLRSLEVYELAGSGRYSLALAVAEGRPRIPGCQGLTLDLDELWTQIDAAAAATSRRRRAR
jgi:Uma2 family endonuclease